MKSATIEEICKELNLNNEVIKKANRLKEEVKIKTDRLNCGIVYIACFLERTKRLQIDFKKWISTVTLRKHYKKVIEIVGEEKLYEL